MAEVCTKGHAVFIGYFNCCLDIPHLGGVGLNPLLPGRPVGLQFPVPRLALVGVSPPYLEALGSEALTERLVVLGGAAGRTVLSTHDAEIPTTRTVGLVPPVRPLSTASQ